MEDESNLWKMLAGRRRKRSGEMAHLREDVRASESAGDAREKVGETDGDELVIKVELFAHVHLNRGDVERRREGLPTAGDDLGMRAWRLRDEGLVEAASRGLERLRVQWWRWSRGLEPLRVQ